MVSVQLYVCLTCSRKNGAANKERTQSFILKIKSRSPAGGRCWCTVLISLWLSCLRKKKKEKKKLRVINKAPAIIIWAASGHSCPMSPQARSSQRCRNYLEICPLIGLFDSHKNLKEKNKQKKTNKMSHDCIKQLKIANELLLIKRLEFILPASD